MMSLECVVFYSLAALTVLTALAVVTLKNTFHAALMLGLCLAGVAGIFGTLGADYLFAAQILIYVSGIAVLILFVVLLAGRASDFILRQVNEQWLWALAIAGAFLAALAAIFEPLRDQASAAPASTTAPIGALMLSDYAIPFELISILLMAALLGAVVFSTHEDEGEKG